MEWIEGALRGYIPKLGEVIDYHWVYYHENQITEQLYLIIMLFHRYFILFDSVKQTIINERKGQKEKKKRIVLSEETFPYHIHKHITIRISNHKHASDRKTFLFYLPILLIKGRNIDYLICNVNRVIFKISQNLLEIMQLYSMIHYLKVM